MPPRDPTTAQQLAKFGCRGELRETVKIPRDFPIFRIFQKSQKLYPTWQNQSQLDICHGSRPWDWVHIYHKKSTIHGSVIPFVPWIIEGARESIIQFHDHMFRPSLLMKNTCDEFRMFGKKRTENVFGKNMTFIVWWWAFFVKKTTRLLLFSIFGCFRK